jgi:hypothetical protein
VVDLADLCSKGSGPNLRRIKFPNRAKSRCLPIQVGHFIFEKVGFIQGTKGVDGFTHKETYWSKSTVDVECAFVWTTRDVRPRFGLDPVQA